MLPCNFSSLDKEARNEAVKVIFLLNSPLSDKKLETLLVENNFTINTPFDSHVVNSNEEKECISMLTFQPDVQIPSIIYYMDGEVEYIKAIQHDDYYESFKNLVRLAEQIAVKHDVKIFTSMTFLAAVSYVELSPSADEVFREAFGQMYDELKKNILDEDLLLIEGTPDLLHIDDKISDFINKTNRRYGDVKMFRYRRDGNK
jgi:hypothetical protein